MIAGDHHDTVEHRHAEQGTEPNAKIQNTVLVLDPRELPEASLESQFRHRPAQQRIVESIQHR
ncbi:MAG: hypothetical protein A3G81_20760 [Betaproteobacteria bacterium RIFCSPLOWO2_12_FULL_65_14]|nr:MAG: hypothetical protein A3G81_20760 [Betaproteobacteria bacterium RIFCSPLOWO2_12_FULL_65_14]